MQTGLIDALQGLCRATNTEPETTRRILAAAKGERPARDDLIKTRAAAEILDCHPKSVFRYARRGLLHPIRRSPRALRWRKSEVERLATEGASV